MENFSIEGILETIKSRYFYDLKSTIISICVICACYFFMKLLKDNGDKVVKSLKYLTCFVVSVVVFSLLRNA